MKAFITDYVRTARINTIGRVFAIHQNFNQTGQDITWFNSQEPSLEEFTKYEMWYSILCNGGGAILVPESDITSASTEPFGQQFSHLNATQYFRDAQINKKFEALKKVKRLDICGINNGEFIEIHETEDDQGSFVKWEEIEKILKE